MHNKLLICYKRRRSMSSEQLKAKTARELDTQKVADEAIKIVIEHLIWAWLK